MFKYSGTIRAGVVSCLVRLQWVFGEQGVVRDSQVQVLGSRLQAEVKARLNE
jgi:hypothetical protein